jgi:CubicO group peptidase (beta-lactamase class C family)
MTHRLLVALLVMLTAAAPLAAQQDPRIDSVFSAWQRTDGPGCIAGVRQNGTTLHLQAYGMANLEYGVPLTPESVSESGSVAKQFTAAVLLLLEQQGKLSLDDDIRKHVPQVPDFGRRITLRNFLTHTSGIRDQWALLALAGWPPGTQVHSIDQIVHLVSRQQRLNFPPGELYLYSNTGYTLLAAVVRNVTGQSLADWSREHLFRPLGMEHTQWRDDYRRVVPTRATAYSRGGGSAWVQDMPFTMVYGNGGLLTTVPDLLRWNDALSNGTAPLSRDLVRQMETPMRLNDGTTISYALGLGVNTWRGVQEVSHGGATAGYRTQLSRWPERNLSIAILCNAGNANPAQYARQIAQRLLSLPAEEVAPAPAAAIAAAELAPLAGTWRDTLWDRSVIFSVQDGKLMASAGGPATPFTHLGSLRFWSPVAGEVKFERNGSTWRLVQQLDGRHEYVRQNPVEPGSVNLADYAGRYRSDELDVTYQIQPLGERLTLKRGWESAAPLLPIYPDGFSVQGRTIRFMRDAAGRVTGFRVFAGRALDVRFTRLLQSENQ